MIITAGHGAFEPRKLGIEGIDEWQGRGLHYVVREKAQFEGKRCVIVGGGDLRLDWTAGPRTRPTFRSRSSTGAIASARSSRP